MVKIGAELKLKPFVNLDFYGRTVTKPVPCRVVGINERHGFYRVEFRFPNGCRYFESFRIVGGDMYG